MTTQLTKRAVMLMYNSSEYYVVSDKDDNHELKHKSELSAILEDKEPIAKFGYVEIEKCWDGEDLSTGDDWVQ